MSYTMPQHCQHLLHIVTILYNNAVRWGNSSHMGPQSPDGGGRGAYCRKGRGLARGMH